MNFTEMVLEVVRQIPKGSVLTYKEVALRAGNHKASRAVGTLMAKNQNITIPCHRVIKSDGTVGDYNELRGKSKQKLLEKEGVKFSKTKKVIINRI
jgi:O-6-methylguanine DNA methyltransferase